MQKKRPEKVIATPRARWSRQVRRAGCATTVLVVIAGGAAFIVFLTERGPSPRVQPTSAWTTVVYDRFSGSKLPRHWRLYRGPYGNAPRNCASPTHDYVSDGYLHLLEKYERSTPAGVSCPYGAGWYTGGMKLDPVVPYVGDDQRVTLRYRIVSRGGVVSHHIIPMRWPAKQKSRRGTHRGEEDFLDSDTLTGGRFLVYATGRRGRRIRSSQYALRMTRWHTVRITQLSHTVYAYIDDMSKPVWTYQGDSTTIPNVLRTTVLQQECSHSRGCPTRTTGSEDIQVDWITVDTAVTSRKVQW